MQEPKETDWIKLGTLTQRDTINQSPIRIICSTRVVDNLLSRGVNIVITTQTCTHTSMCSCSFCVSFTALAPTPQHHFLRSHNGTQECLLFSFILEKWWCFTAAPVLWLVCTHLVWQVLGCPEHRSSIQQCVSQTRHKYSVSWNFPGESAQV